MIQEFIKVAPVDVGYKSGAKRRFHKLAEAVLLALADKLGYKPGDFDLRHNQGGIAVSGEITLHSDCLYVQFCQCGMQGEFLWRTCIGRKDYTGGANRWMKWARLADLDNVADCMKSAVEAINPPYVVPFRL